MSRKWDAIRGSAEFYVTMAVCLLVIAVSGYFLLFGGESPEERLEADPPAGTAAAQEASAPDLAPEAQTQVMPEAPAVEALEPVEVPASMPEVEVDPTPVAAEAPGLIVHPLEGGEVVSAFSMDALAYNPTLGDWRTHDGVDIAAGEGTAVLAAAAGTVRSVEDDPLMGTTVVIDHPDGHQTTYANLQPEPKVQKGDSVSAGQILGAVGATAAAEASQEPHLHFSVTKDGQPVDPQTYLEG